MRVIEKTIRKKKVKREALIDCVIPGGISYFERFVEDKEEKSDDIGGV